MWLTWVIFLKTCLNDEFEFTSFLLQMWLFLRVPHRSYVLFVFLNAIVVPATVLAFSNPLHAEHLNTGDKIDQKLLRGRASTVRPWAWFGSCNSDARDNGTILYHDMVLVVKQIVWSFGVVVKLVMAKVSSLERSQDRLIVRKKSFEVSVDNLKCTMINGKDCSWFVTILYVNL